MAHSRPLHTPSTFLALLVANPTSFLLTRDREIAAAPSYYRVSQEETRKETGCRFCDSQHWDGCFKHWWYVLRAAGAPRSKPFPVSAASWSDPLTLFLTGMTIHSWGAVTPGQTDLDKQIKCIRKCKPALNRWRTTKVLVIDEGERLDSRSHLTMLD